MIVGFVHGHPACNWDTKVKLNDLQLRLGTSITPQVSQKKLNVTTDQIAQTLLNKNSND